MVIRGPQLLAIDSFFVFNFFFLQNQLTGMYNTAKNWGSIGMGGF